MAIDAGYGDTNSGKSLAIERLAGHIFDVSGKRTRVYSSDGGQDTYNDRGLVDDGVIEVMDVSVRPWPMTIMKMISDFYFLKDPKDPNSKLIAPPADLYEKYGLMVFEGGTTMGNWMLSDIPGGMAWQAANQTGFGGIKDEDGQLFVKDEMKDAGEYTLQGATSAKHFMLTQRKLLTAIRTTKKFPGLVFWTFHPTEGPDKTAGGESGQYGKITGKKIIGPDAGGKALASTIGKEFGSLLHFDQVTLTKKELDETSKKQITQVDKEFRLYTRRHFDPDQNVLVEYVAGTRSTAVEDYYVSKMPGDSLLQYYQAVKEARQAAREKLSTKKETA